jgi:hypothetical protein
MSRGVKLKTSAAVVGADAKVLDVKEGCDPMKDVASGSNGQGCQEMITPPVPFAENRYRRHRFDRESIELNAPESSGVYGLFSALWIYIGETDNIKTRLLEHFDGDDHDPCIAQHQPTGFAFELIPPEGRSRRREQPLKELLPICKGDGLARQERP